MYILIEKKMFTRREARRRTYKKRDGEIGNYFHVHYLL